MALAPRGSSEIHRRTVYVHDFVAKTKERLSVQRLRKEVGEVVRGVHVGHHELFIFHEFADVEMPTFDMLDLFMMFRII